MVKRYRLWAFRPPLFAGSQARWLSLAWSFSHALRGLEHVQVFDLIHFTDARESLFYDLRSPAVGNVNDTYAADMAPLGYYRRYYEDWLWRWAYYRFVKLAESCCPTSTAWTHRKQPAYLQDHRFAVWAAH